MSRCIISRDQYLTSMIRFVCAMRASDRRIIRLANYPSPVNDEERAIKIWEAARATSASPGYFESLSIGRYGEQFLDGTLGANNPVREVLQAAQELWPEGPITDRIACLISIGTGVQPVRAMSSNILDIQKNLRDIATDTESTAESFFRENRKLFLDNIYFRFNVSRGLESVTSDEIAKLFQVRAATEFYIDSGIADQQLRYAAVRLTPSQKVLTPPTPNDGRNVSPRPSAESNLTDRTQTVDVALPSSQRRRSGPPITVNKDIKLHLKNITSADQEFNEIIRNLANCLVQDPTIRVLCQAALERIGNERFERNIARLLQRFAKDLASENTLAERAVSRMVVLSCSILFTVQKHFACQLYGFVGNTSDCFNCVMR